MRSKKPFTALHRFAAQAFSAVRNGFRWGLPVGIGIETSTACNRRCHYCPQSINGHKQKIISGEVWEMFLYRLREANWKGVVSLTFYNEPSIVPNFWRYVEDVAATGAFPLIFTNGDHPEQVDRWIECGARRVVVTEHPPYSPAWQRKAYALKKRHPWRVDVKKLQQFVWREQGGLSIDGEPMTECAFSGGMSIMVDGHVVLCCIDYEGESHMGTIMNRSLWDIWFDPRYVDARKKVQSGEEAEEICNGCLCH